MSNIQFPLLVGGYVRNGNCNRTQNAHRLHGRSGVQISNQCPHRKAITQSIWEHPLFSKSIAAPAVSTYTELRCHRKRGSISYPGIRIIAASAKAKASLIFQTRTRGTAIEAGLFGGNSSKSTPDAHTTVACGSAPNCMLSFFPREPDM